MMKNWKTFIGMLKKSVENSQNFGQPFTLSTINQRMQLDFSIRFILFWLDNTIHQHGQIGLNCRCHLIQHQFGDGTCILSVWPFLISCICYLWYRQLHTLLAVAFTLQPCVIILISSHIQFKRISIILIRKSRIHTSAMCSTVKFWKKWKKSFKFK